MGRTSNARERLIEAGGALMHERGYTAAGVNEVCLAAGVKKGSFYHFFPSKVDLALSVIDRQSAEIDSALDDLLSGAAPPLERLAAYAEAMRRHHTEIQARHGTMLGCPFGNLALEMSTREPALRERLGAVFDRMVQVFGRVVREAVERGDVPPQDADRAGRSVLALLEGHIMLAKINDDPEMLRGVGREIVHRLASALG